MAKAKKKAVKITPRNDEGKLIGRINQYLQRVPQVKDGKYPLPKSIIQDLQISGGRKIIYSDGQRDVASVYISNDKVISTVIDSEDIENLGRVINDLTHRALHYSETIPRQKVTYSGGRPHGTPRGRANPRGTNAGRSI